MTAEVWRVDTERRAATANGHVGDIGVTVAGVAPAANVQLTMMFDTALPFLGNGACYDCYLLDETGCSLRVDCGLDETLLEQTFTFEGNGKMPEVLILYVLESYESHWDLHGAINGSIGLTYPLWEMNYKKEKPMQTTLNKQLLAVMLMVLVVLFAGHSLAEEAQIHLSKRLTSLTISLTIDADVTPVEV